MPLSMSDLYHAQMESPISKKGISEGGNGATMPNKLHSTSFLCDPDPKSIAYISAVIILNSPINVYNDDNKNPLLDALIKSATPGYVFCADGGGNRLYNYSRKSQRPSEQIVPDLIIGDLDSLEKEVRLHYEGKKTQSGGLCAVVHNPDQDSNDLEKALSALYQKITTFFNANGIVVNRPQTRVSIYGAFGGRFDQEASSINSLYRFTRLFPQVGETSGNEDSDSFDVIHLFDDKNVATLLIPGVVNVVQLNEICEDGCCGLLPIGGPCTVTTSGLKWDLDGTLPLAFGGLVSSSNQVLIRRHQDDSSGEGGVVKVVTDSPLVLTMSLRSDFFLKNKKN
eukprot:CAMPEP_0113297828 /NCGR_PEP_ID=MMETSP0010_2-20120614/523_1 /TAXON_ID=216773 ORGANISM="Corethron hystrix, Strain 308" /NCGR_SAMPLE_ID=MMETSP0010_2 /ASSEMBLY_ACC=CAM_ASM_000155 /LENGTH=338 /DNA_ID=CAMNT_0000150773 /DNA_START=110 /DNA_END=1126 /DNA_ORIENTATION=- /assembly_acc=CAM_ASM_000155